MPCELVHLIVAFAPLFSKPVFEHVKVLLQGAILAPGKRTVTQALRVMGKSQEPHFQTYHRVLNRAAWRCLDAARILLHLLIAAFAPSGPLVFGLDDTIERRRGNQIKAKGIYRDPVRSSHSHFVKASALALALFDALGQGSLGGSSLGLTFPDGALSVRAIP